MPHGEWCGLSYTAICSCAVVLYARSNHGTHTRVYYIVGCVCVCVCTRSSAWAAGDRSGRCGLVAALQAPRRALLPCHRAATVAPPGAANVSRLHGLLNMRPQKPRVRWLLLLLLFIPDILLQYQWLEYEYGCVCFTNEILKKKYIFK